MSCDGLEFNVCTEWSTVRTAKVSSIKESRVLYSQRKPIGSQSEKAEIGDVTNHLFFSLEGKIHLPILLKKRS